MSVIQDYSRLAIFWFADSTMRLPKEYPSPISADMDMKNRSVIYNFTKPKGADPEEDDPCFGTLSVAALQTIMEYTTRPGDVVVTFNAQFGQVYEAAENCGRLVFGSEFHGHFGDHARCTVQHLVEGEADEGQPDVQQQGTTAEKRTTTSKSDEELEPSKLFCSPLSLCML